MFPLHFTQLSQYTAPLSHYTLGGGGLRYPGTMQCNSIFSAVVAGQHMLLYSRPCRTLHCYMVIVQWTHCTVHLYSMDCTKQTLFTVQCAVYFFTLITATLTWHNAKTWQCSKARSVECTYTLHCCTVYSVVQFFTDCTVLYSGLQCCTWLYTIIQCCIVF